MPILLVNVSPSLPPSLSLSGKGTWGGRRARLFEPRRRGQQVPPASEHCPGRWPCHGAALLAPRTGGSVQHARGNIPSAGSPMETLIRLLLPLESQVWPSSHCPVTARRARAAPCQAGLQSEGLTKPYER